MGGLYFVSASILVRVVIGYHEVTPVPQQAIDERLDHRFAVAIEMHGNGLVTADDQESDRRTMLAVLREMAGAIDHDALLIEAEGGKECDSVEALESCLEAIPEDDRMPPLCARFSSNGELVCLEETEFWSLCGGPWPYSDSDTLSFYTREDMSEVFLAACSAACERASAELQEAIGASVCPVVIPT
jgi:hypothetical protein